MNIKNTLSVFAFIAIVLYGCKKEDRTCSCTVTRKGTSTTTAKVEQVIFGFPLTLADTSFEKSITDVQAVDKVMEDVTKKTAKGNCYNFSQPYNETVITAVPAASFEMQVSVTNKGIETYSSCKLK
jgi:hypothetical protein